MGWLIYDEVVLPHMLTVPQAEKQATLPADYWMGIFVNGDQRAGFVNIRSTPEARPDGPGDSIALLAEAKLNLFGFDAGMRADGKAWLSEDRQLADFDFSLNAGESASRIFGEFKDGTLSATFSTGSVDTPFKFPVSPEMLSGMGLGGPAMDLPVLEPGQEVYIDAFDPATMSTGKARLTCTGREVIRVAGEDVQTSVIEISIGGMTTRAWVSEAQETVKAETPVGVTLKKILPEEALAPVDTGGSQMALLDRTLVRPTGVAISRGVAQMRARITGLPDGTAIPVDAIQRVDAEGSLRIESPNLEVRSGDSLPGEELAAALASDPLVNAEDASIRATAAEATANANDDAAKARALYEWVHDNIRKIPTLSLPAAVDVLRTRAGDCNEHTVLYAAMARSVGLPCRIAIGLVYSEALGGFGYHAWPEVWLGHWVPMDPTLGQPVCDATHIKLLNGGLDQWARLVGFIGRIQIEILEASGQVETESEFATEGEMVQ